MTSVILEATGAKLKATVHGPLTEAAVGITVQVTLNSDWDDIIPKLVFRVNGADRREELKNGQATIPPAALIGRQELKVGIDGWNSDWTVRIPTMWATLGTVLPSPAKSNPALSDPDPDKGILDQVLREVHEMRQNTDAAGDAAEKAYIAANAAAGAAQNAGAAAQAAQEAAGSINIAVDAAVRAAEAAEEVRTDADDGKFDGFSPYVTVEKVEDGHNVTITDAHGDHTFPVKDGNGVAKVQSVNGQTGAVNLKAKDVGALPEGYHDDTKQDSITDLNDIRRGAELGKTALQSVPDSYRTAAAQDDIDRGKQSTITDLDEIRAGAERGKTALQSVPNTYRTAAAQDDIDRGKQPAISDLEAIRSGAALGRTALQRVPDSYRTADDQDEIDNGLSQRIDAIEASKFPNAVFIGEPLIVGATVSRFTSTDYMIFPFMVDVRNKPFSIEFAFHTGADVTRQQNILDSYFGMALAIQNGRGIMALSSNGSSWDIGLVTGSMAIAPNTNYYAKISWDGSAYTGSLSTDGETYISDMYAASTAGLYPQTMYIGGAPDLFGTGSAHPFGGGVDMAHSRLIVAGLEVWHGMDDPGLASRANVSLSNLDALGKEKFKAQNLPYEDDEGETTVGEALNGLKGDLSHKITSPANPVAGKILKVLAVNEDGTFTCEWADGGSGGVKDVQVNGTTVVEDDVANIQGASKTVAGVVSGHPNYDSFEFGVNGRLLIMPTSNVLLDARNTYGNRYRALTMNGIDYALEIGLGDGKGQEWSKEHQENAQIRLGILSVEEVLF